MTVIYETSYYSIGLITDEHKVVGIATDLKISLTSDGTVDQLHDKLKGNWYDMANYNITLYQYLHSKDVTDFIKEFFKTEVVFSARPCIFFKRCACIQ